MLAKRAAAVVVAVALVAGALLLRNNVIEGSDDDTEPTSSTSPPALAAGSIVCANELRAACDAIAASNNELDVVVEPAGDTLDRLVAVVDPTDAPVWLTIAPFPAMADELRASINLSPLAGDVEPVAASPLSIATETGGRSATLEAACAGTPLWRCIGERAGDPWTELGGEAAWSTVRPSLGLVEREAVALASFANAVAGYTGSPQISSATFSDPAFIAWLRRLSGAVDEQAISAGTPLATMGVRPPLDIAATTEAERAAIGVDRFDVNYPEPTMSVEAVLAVPDGSDVPDDLVTTARDALTATGWGDPATSAQSLPPASTMLALRSLWGEAT